jgi:hemoglobin-like flavoprotein
MTEASRQRIANHYQTIAPRLHLLAQAFYDRLFTVLPEARPLFKIDIPLQSQHLAAALALIIHNLRFLDALEEPLKELGIHHARVGVRPEHYPILCRTMIQSLAEGSGDAWCAELHADWTELLAWVSRIMMDGALSDAVSRHPG